MTKDDSEMAGGKTDWNKKEMLSTEQSDVILCINFLGT